MNESEKLAGNAGSWAVRQFDSRREKLFSLPLTFLLLATWPIFQYLQEGTKGSIELPCANFSQKAHPIFRKCAYSACCSLVRKKLSEWKYKDCIIFLRVLHTICIKSKLYGQIVLTYLIMYFNSGVTVRIILNFVFNLWKIAAK